MKVDRLFVLLKQVYNNHIDDIIVFAIVSSIMAFSANAWLKMIMIIIGLCYVLFNKTLKFTKNILWLSGFLLVNFFVATYSSHPLDILQSTFDRLALYMVAMVIISSIYQTNDKTKGQTTVKLAKIVIVNVLFILIMYIPNIMTSDNVWQYRLDGYTYLSLTYTSANTLAFIIFATQVLMIYLVIKRGLFGYNQQKINIDTKRYSKYIFVILQVILFFFAFMTHTRGYFVFWFLFIIVYFALRFYQKYGINSKLVLLVIGIFGGIVLLFLILQDNEYLINWLNYIQQQTSSKMALHRFISLFKIFLAQDYIVDGSTLERLNLIKLSWNIFVENPIFGVGLGTFHHFVFDSIPKGIYVYSSLHSHVELFEILSASGIVGAVAYYGSYYKLLKSRKNNIILVSLLITVLISGLFYMRFYAMYFWWLIVTIMYIEIGEYYEIK